MAKILIIDDEATTRLTLKKSLQNAGYDVFVAIDGVEGIKLAENLHPDLIICDWMMPLMDGLKV